MGRIRTVKPELFTHEDLFSLEAETGLPVRLAFVGLFTICDREGRFKWEPNRIKLAVLPYDQVDFSRVLDALRTRDMVRQYSFDGKLFGFIPTFLKHQVINNRETVSSLPEPIYINELGRVDDASITRASHVVDAPLGEGKGKEGKGNGREKESEHRAAPPSGDAELFPGVDPQVIADFKALRKQKRAAITKTAMDKISSEAAKAGLSLEAVLSVCCSRGWQGFEASWLEPRASQTNMKQANQQSLIDRITRRNNDGPEQHIIDIN